MGVTRAFLRLSGNTPVVRDPLMIFVKHGLIMSHIDFKIFTGIVLRLLDFAFRLLPHIAVIYR